MPVTIDEYVKITDVEGVEHEGKAIATNLVAIKDGDNTYYGAALKITKVRVKVVCDNDKCENAEVGEDFVTRPKTIEFDDDGNAARNVQEITDIIIVSDYMGKKLTFCTAECHSSYVRRAAREKLTVSVEKTPRQVYYPSEDPAMKEADAAYRDDLAKERS